MSYTIANLKDDLVAALHGANLNKVKNVNGVIERSARQLISDIDPYTTRRTVQITNAIYSQIYDYILPTDVKGNKIVDIRPQEERISYGNYINNNNNYSGFSRPWVQKHNVDFDLNKDDRTFTVMDNSGVRTLQISKNVRPGITINEMTDVNVNGTWTVGDDAENLVQDRLYYVSNNASLKFDSTGITGTSYIENSTMLSVDLSTYEDIGALFNYWYLPETLINLGITSMTLRWGSSSSNYWEKTVTTNHDTTLFQIGWNLLRYDWESAIEVGTPDSSDITYARLTINYTSGTSLTAIRVDNLVARLGSIYNIDYYSKYLFKSSAGVWSDLISDDSDIINLDTTSYNILFNKCIELLSRNNQGANSNFDFQTYTANYRDDIKNYKLNYPSEYLRPQVTYYSFDNYNNYYGNGTSYYGKF